MPLLGNIPISGVLLFSPFFQQKFARKEYSSGQKDKKKEGKKVIRELCELKRKMKNRYMSYLLSIHFSASGLRPSKTLKRLKDLRIIHISDI